MGKERENSEEKKQELLDQREETTDFEEFLTEDEAAEIEFLEEDKIDWAKSARERIERDKANGTFPGLVSRPKVCRKCGLKK